MNVSRFGAICGMILALAMPSLAPSSFAQQNSAPAPAPPALSQAPAGQAPVPPVVQAPTPAAAAQAAPPPSDVAAPGGSRSLKAEALRELSPWSMFLSAD